MHHSIAGTLADSICPFGGSNLSRARSPIKFCVLYLGSGTGPVGAGLRIDKDAAGKLGVAVTLGREPAEPRSRTSYQPPTLTNDRVFDYAVRFRSLGQSP